MTTPPLLNRRVSLGLLGVGAMLPLFPTMGHAAKIESLPIYGPPAGPSVTLAHATATGMFNDAAKSASFTAWRNPDELRAGLTSGTIQLSVVPVQAAANLYNRGFPIRLANVMTNGLLYVISEGSAIGSIPDLAGRKVAVPFKGDTPEIILGQLLVHHGLDAAKDLDITYTASPVEAMQLLLSGRVEAALTAEPSTTAGVLKGKKAGKSVTRVINIQEAWGAMTGAAPVVPQAGLAVTMPFLDSHSDMLPELLTIMETATADVLANPGAAAKNATKALGLPAPLLAASVPNCNLVARRAQEARGDVERMLTTMAGNGFAKIGGKLPDDGFYL